MSSTEAVEKSRGSWSATLSLSALYSFSVNSVFSCLVVNIRNEISRGPREQRLHEKAKRMLSGHESGNELLNVRAQGLCLIPLLSATKHTQPSRTQSIAAAAAKASEGVSTSTSISMGAPAATHSRCRCSGHGLGADCDDVTLVFKNRRPMRDIFMAQDRSIRGIYASVSACWH